jgi:hypothetical protein
MTINYVINVVGGIFFSFYIFKGEKIRNDYIQQCKPRSCMEMQKNMDGMLFVQNFIFLYSISNREFVSIEYAPSNYRWTWITCYSISNQANI